jgi:hypothetical protein
MTRATEPSLIFHNRFLFYRAPTQPPPKRVPTIRSAHESHMVIHALSGTVDGYTSDWRISRHPRIKLLSELIIAYMRERVSFFLALLVLSLAVLFSHNSDRVNPTVVDVSWPNCKAKLVDYQSGIIGVTGGRNFHSNPCLTQESTHFLSYAVYINTGYPGTAYGRHFQNSPRRCNYNDTLCLAYNYGFNETEYAIHYANLNNVHTMTWWLDVETENSWSDNFLANRQFIDGAVDGLRQNIRNVTVGIYSSPLQWQQIVGPWHNKLSVWQATGSTSSEIAAQVCHDKSFTAGPIRLAQYTVFLDQNIACPNQ